MLSTNWKGYRFIAWAGIIVLIAAIILMIVQQNWIATGSLLLFLVAAGLFMKFDKLLPTLFDMLFVIAALINAGGWAWDLYNKPGPYDEIAHTYTIFALTLAIGFLLFDRLMSSFYDHRVLFVVMIACLGISIGALWEVGEWTADFFVAKQIVSGLDDTITDIILDSVGAVVAGLANVYALHERSRSELKKDSRKGNAPPLRKPRTV